MGSPAFSPKSIFLILCLFLGAIICAAADAAERQEEFSLEQSACPIVLLKNRDYFPALLKAIDEAGSEIIMSFFLVKAGVRKNSYPDIVLAHLVKAAQRGVKVVVILENSGGRGHNDAENRRTKQNLASKGVEVYFDSPRKTTHTKLVVVDKRLVLLGSHNLTQSALKYNNEISVLLDRPDLAHEARNYMLAILKEAK